MSRKYKYVGPSDAVDLVGNGEVQRDETVEVDKEIADGLEGQADWQHIPDPKRSRAAKKAAETRAENDDNNTEES